MLDMSTLIPKVKESPRDFGQLFAIFVQINVQGFSVTNFRNICRELLVIAVEVKYGFSRSNAALDRHLINQSNCEFQSWYTIKLTYCRLWGNLCN